MKKFANLYLVFVFVILYLPIFYLIAYSFNSGGDMNHFKGFTLCSLGDTHWYLRVYLYL